MKRYSKYKDIGLPWFPNGIPSHWITSRHKNVLKEHKELVGINSEKYTQIVLKTHNLLVKNVNHIFSRWRRKMYS